jgi:hypothetical protein
MDKGLMTMSTKTNRLVGTDGAPDYLIIHACNGLALGVKPLLLPVVGDEQAKVLGIRVRVARDPNSAIAVTNVQACAAINYEIGFSKRDANRCSLNLTAMIPDLSMATLEDFKTQVVAGIQGAITKTLASYIESPGATVGLDEIQKFVEETLCAEFLSVYPDHKPQAKEAITGKEGKVIQVNFGKK